MAFLLLAGTAGVRAQQCDVPQIGAQVFVEPGQTPEVSTDFSACCAITG